MNRTTFLLGMALALTGGLAAADDTRIGKITIGHAYVWATAAPGQPASAYVKFDNQGGADRLVSASTSAALRVELHEMEMDGDVMRMRQLPAIELPAGRTVELKPGGLHMMLIGPRAPLKAGEAIQLKLKFEKAGEVTLPVTVEPAGKKPAMH